MRAGVEQKYSERGGILVTNERCVAKIFLVINSLVLIIFAWDAKIASSLGDVDFIFFHRGMVHMVSMMRNLPAEKRRK